MKNERTKMWADRLRDPELMQGAGVLARVGDNGDRAYCCLGVACEFLVPDVYQRVDSDDWAVAFDDQKGLAPTSLMDWLFEEEWNRPPDADEKSYEFDITIDWPDDLMVLGPYDSGEEREARSDFDINTAAGLNDHGFTFSQIADIIEYFGVRYDD